MCHFSIVTFLSPLSSFYSVELAVRPKSYGLTVEDHFLSISEKKDKSRNKEESIPGKFLQTHGLCLCSSFKICTNGFAPFADWEKMLSCKGNAVLTDHALYTIIKEEMP